MISEQIQALRDVANVYKGSGIELILKDASNTIEELSAKLANANMERSEQFYSDGWIPCDRELPPRPGIDDEPKAYLVTVKRNDGFIFWDKLFYHHFGWNIPSTCKIIAWKEVQPYVKGE